MIIDKKKQQEILNTFPFIEKADSKFIKTFFELTSLANIPERKVVSEYGVICANLALILSGSVKVYKMSRKGREVTLYRIGKGDSCVLTAACLMNSNPFPATAKSETEVEALLIPATYAKAWTTQNSWWNEFVFNMVSDRFGEIIDVLDNAIFIPVEARLAYFLLNNAETQSLGITHQQIADELGTSREVVSRILKGFEKQALVKLNRGAIEILDYKQLKTISNK